jgi:hypothetical protein
VVRGAAPGCSLHPGLSSCGGGIRTEIAPEVADDPELAARLDDLLHRTCHLARALTGAEQAAFKVDLDGDGHAARKFFNLRERYERWRDYRVDPRGRGLHGLDLAPDEVVRLTQAEVEDHPAWQGFGNQAAAHPPMRGWLATAVGGAGGHAVGVAHRRSRLATTDWPPG